MGIILIIFGIIYLIRRPKIAGMRAYDHPEVPAPEFERWRQLEIWSIDVFLIATFGIAAVAFIAGIVTGAVMTAGGSSPDQIGIVALVLTVGQIVLFLIGLIVSAVFGSRAASLRKKYGIKMP